MKKSQNIASKFAPGVLIIGLVLLWHWVTSAGHIEAFMLPSPQAVLLALIQDFPLLLEHAKTTLLEAFLGLGFGITFGFLAAMIMDRYEVAYRAFYPLMVLSQTIPTVALAPLLVTWLGYGIEPKITLIVLTSFFPIAVGLLDGFQAVDRDFVNLMKAMGATRWQLFTHLKFPSSLNYFYAGLRISVSYSIIGAVVAEWLGGFSGLGVYITRVRKAYSFDKMFAVIIIISLLSLCLMWCVKRLQILTQPWLRTDERKQEH